MVAAIQVSTISEVSQETSTDFFVIPIRKNHCAIKKVDEFKDEATEVLDSDTEGEVVIFKLLQPQVSMEQQHKLVCGNQQGVLWNELLGLLGSVLCYLGLFISY
ncbi:Uncharacterized protein Rs2_18749 [Raphanus sativus]|nr:Uncharacterized protein Rs2_18749 [Raphanus sativus]